jgi:hypothetical protein
MIRRAVALLLVGLSACGYRLAHAPADPAGPFRVVVAGSLAPESAAAAAMEEGARAELARSGQLAPSGGAAIEVELVRVDEAAEGVAIARGRPDGVMGGSSAKPSGPPSLLPLGRGLRIAVIGRARVRPAAGAAVIRDTGDVRADEVVAAAGGPAAALVARDEAVRIAARRLGERLVRHALGIPDPGSP